MGQGHAPTGAAGGEDEHLWGLWGRDEHLWGGDGHPLGLEAGDGTDRHPWGLWARNWDTPCGVGTGSPGVRRGTHGGLWGRN